jgi:hypothetical protein
VWGQDAPGIQTSRDRRCAPAPCPPSAACDLASNLLTLQYPQDGAAAYFGYDDGQRLVQGLSPAAKACYYTYDPSSNVTRKELGNGVVMWGAYDQADRVSSLRYAKPDGTAVAYFDYGWDAAGRILRIAREDDLVVYYGYDDVDRLTGEVWRKQSDGGQIYGFWYDYDAGHNRVKMRRESSAGVEAESAYYPDLFTTERTETTETRDPVGNGPVQNACSSSLRKMQCPSSVLSVSSVVKKCRPHGLVTRIAPQTGA